MWHMPVAALLGVCTGELYGGEEASRHAGLAVSIAKKNLTRDGFFRTPRRY